MVYTHRDYWIPERMMEPIRLYIEEGIKPGSFLTSVICNDLKGAVGNADDENLPNLPAFVAYFYNEAPGSCWGSKEMMERWIRDRREAA